MFATEQHKTVFLDKEGKEHTTKELAVEASVLSIIRTSASNGYSAKAIIGFITKHEEGARWLNQQCTPAPAEDRMSVLQKRLKAIQDRTTAHGTTWPSPITPSDTPSQAQEKVIARVWDAIKEHGIRSGCKPDAADEVKAFYAWNNRGPEEVLRNIGVVLYNCSVMDRQYWPGEEQE